MNILRHLSSFAHSPDEPAAPEPEVIEPVAEAPVEELAPDPEPPPETETPEVKPTHGNRGQTPWFQRVIAEVREEKRQEKSAREAAEQRASDLQAIIERMQTSGDKPEPAKAAAPAPTNFEAAVKAQAAKDRLYEDTAVVRSAGESAFDDFKDSLAILNAIGATNDDFVADILAVDKSDAHKILDKLAKDPEKAASMVGMDSRRRIVEITRMADALKTEIKPAVEAPKPAAVSRAPAPKPAMSPLAAPAEVDPTTPEGNEKMSDAQFEKWYKDKYLKRA